VRCFFNSDGGHHGKEEKSQESSKEKEKEEGSKEESQEEVVKQIREEENGQEKIREKDGKAKEENGEASCGKAGNIGTGHGACIALYGRSAGGKNCPEPRSGMAVSDGLQALSGLRMNCGSARRNSGLDRRHSGLEEKREEKLPPALRPSDLRSLSGSPEARPVFFPQFRKMGRETGVCVTYCCV